MSILYFHDAAKQMVMSGPAHPEVREKKTRRGDPNGWQVTATFEITRADNYTLPNSNQMAFPLRQIYSQDFETRDTEDSAARHFVMNKYPNLPQVKEEEYLHYREVYRQRAECNRAS